ncbi:MAG: GNAT family N-acetyltransferase [Cypionkella sp.]|nr:GNAT family N-acetyltransferase [Cypionkella sp.]
MPPIAVGHGRTKVLIARESPLGADLSLLMARHTADMRADTPPESCHMMDAAQLAIPEVQFFVGRIASRAVAMGAIKDLGAGHAEVKSMHVLAEHRGKGLSRAMLDYLVTAAKASGYSRLSLETGSQDMFEPARQLYQRSGFTLCPPFEGYALDPNSVYMTRALA